MELSEIEREILEKASEKNGTSYENHTWISEADFNEIIEKMINKELLGKSLHEEDKYIKINK